MNIAQQLRDIKNLFAGRKKTTNVPITVPELEKILVSLSSKTLINIEYNPEYKDPNYPIKNANPQHAVRFVNNKFGKVGENDVVEVRQQVYQGRKSRRFYFDLVRKDNRDNEVYRRATLDYGITILRRGI